MKDHLTWIRPDQGLPLLSAERVLVVTDEGTVMTLSGIRCCDWSARGMIRCWAEIPMPADL